MEFHLAALVFRAPREYLSLREVWQIRDEEISPTGRLALTLADDRNASDTLSFQNVAWLCQAVQEFQDLQEATLPREGRFWSINYLFFEGLATLRESILTGLNGYLRASLTLLRVALEMLTFHYWWRARLRFADTYEQFYDWAEGRKASPPFRSVIGDTFRDLEPIGAPASEDEFRDVYRRLCSYAHKPLIPESVTAIRGGNHPYLTQQEVAYWLETTHDAVRCMLYVMVHRNPICLYPRDLARKFGFNPPMGVFFDASNGLVLERALGDTLLEELRGYYRAKDPPSTQLEWFDAFPDLDNQTILDTWCDEEPVDDADRPFEDRVFTRYAVLKAKARVLQRAMAYNVRGPSIEELAAFLGQSAHPDGQSSAQRRGRP